MLSLVCSCYWSSRTPSQSVSQGYSRDGCDNGACDIIVGDGNVRQFWNEGWLYVLFRRNSSSLKTAHLILQSVRNNCKEKSCHLSRTCSVTGRMEFSEIFFLVRIRDWNNFFLKGSLGDHCVGVLPVLGLRYGRLLYPHLHGQSSSLWHKRCEPQTAQMNILIIAFCIMVTADIIVPTLA